MGSKLGQDKGYQGYAPEGMTIMQPKKKPRHGELSQTEKERNRAISGEHIEIEHQISGVKRSRIVSHRLRSRTEYYADKVMETACGLHNYRLEYRPAINLSNQRLFTIMQPERSILDLNNPAPA